MFQLQVWWFTWYCTTHEFIECPELFFQWRFLL